MFGLALRFVVVVLQGVSKEHMMVGTRATARVVTPRRKREHSCLSTRAVDAHVSSLCRALLSLALRFRQFSSACCLDQVVFQSVSFSQE